MSALPMQPTAPDGTALTAWLGVLDWNLLRFCTITPLLLCVLIGLLRDLRDGWLELAQLYEMKCLDEDERNRDNDQPKSQPVKPSGQSDNRLSLSVQLRRKAFLLRRNANKLDHLFFKPLRLLLQLLSRTGLLLSNKKLNLCQQNPLAIRGSPRQTLHIFKMILDKSLRFCIHKRARVTPNDPAQAGRASDVRLPTERRSRPCLQPDGSAKPWSPHFRSENDCGPAESNSLLTARSRRLSQTANAATTNASTATPSFQGEESIVAPPMTSAMPPMTPMQERSMSRTASASV
jgi:hypothetical protein